ncbi:MAG: PhoH family protein [Spirochaetes bacterium]|nr:PhoH family protein [Spirochaetota bacterium]
MTDNTIIIDDISLYKRICGFGDRNIKAIENHLDVKIIPRGNTLIVDAPEKDAKKAMKLIHLISDYLHMNGNGYELNEVDIKYLAKTIASGKNIDTGTIKKLKINIPETGKTILPRTTNQADYIHSIHKKAVTFSYGPAGTGKTYLAVAVALHYLNAGQMKRIVLTRPAVEAGESLGFLPGDLIQKINPYLRPLYDALFDLMPYERIPKLIDAGSIEIAPLAYMRGRTLNDSFIILDEAQNTTKSQMKMILTRIGNNSKIVISGDITQIDLDKPKNSGLLHAMKILKNIEEIGFIQFTKEDICRHPIVEKIVAAYEKHEDVEKHK